jgi:very-short-patch-repair endonuclease
LRRDCLLRRILPKDAAVPFEPTLSRDTARRLRTNQTEAELKLCSRLRKKQLHGFMFHRQYSIGPFFVDFVCIDAKLTIEVDGSQHADQEERDESRSQFLRDAGYTVLRFGITRSSLKWTKSSNASPTCLSKHLEGTKDEDCKTCGAPDNRAAKGPPP